MKTRNIALVLVKTGPYTAREGEGGSCLPFQLSIKS